MANRNVSHQVKDIDIDVGDFRFELWRYFTNSTLTVDRPTWGGLWPRVATNDPVRSPFGNTMSEWGSELNPLWSMDLFSFIDLTNLGSGVQDVVGVYDGNLTWLEFANTTTGAGGGGAATYGFLQRTAAGAALDERLERRPGAVSGLEEYRLVRKDGRQWIYATPDPATVPERYYLTEVRSREGQLLYALSYARLKATLGTVGPPPVSSVCLVDSSSKHLFLKEVVFRNGNKLVFEYGTHDETIFLPITGWPKSLTQCVLSQVKWQSANTSSSPVVVASYSYNGAQSGWLASGGGVSSPETYAVFRSSSTGPWDLTVKSAAQTQLLSYSFSSVSGPVVESTAGSSSSSASFTVLNLTNTSGGDVCVASPYAQDQDRRLATVSVSNGGSPAATTAYDFTVEYRFFNDWAIGGKHGWAFKSMYEDCLSASSGSMCVSGSIEQRYFGGVNPAASCTGLPSSFNPALTTSRKDKRDGWSADQWGVSPFAVDDKIPIARTWGATTAEKSLKGASGEDYLQSVWYPTSPIYNDGVRWLQATFYNSVLNPYGYAEQHRDVMTVSTSVGHVAADRKQGVSADLLSGSNVTRHLGTLYSTERACISPGIDPLGRTVRVDGPCWLVASGSEWVCEDDRHPVTEIEFYSSSAGGNLAGRVSRVVTFPDYYLSGCSSSQLETVYSDYDAYGHVLEEIDTAGVTTVYTYSGERLTRKDVGTAPITTQYEYEADGRLRHVLYPDGNYEVFCYYAFSTWTGGCPVGNPPSLVPEKQLQWRAKSPDHDGANPVELIRYDYVEDRLSVETRYDANQQIRYRQNYFYDAHGRNSWRGTGATSGAGWESRSVWTTHNFDGADNHHGSGTRYNPGTGGGNGSAPDFCLQSGSGGGGGSPRCAWAEYDRANRMFQFDTHPTAVNSSTESRRTCFDYDTGGNIRRVSLGCTTSDTCVSNSSAGATTACGVAPIDYDVDDFGNVVRVVAPWNAGSGSGETRYEYDAAGNLTKKQTQEMRDNGTGSWLEYSYDSNGRLLEVNKKGYGGTMPLYYLGYDNPLLETGCPATTNVKGRLAYREDSFGRTWYSYDQQGHVVDEIRQRAGTYGSCSGDLADNPSTHYTYSGNGVLTGITYPYGREVSYVLGTGGLEDRVDHIDIKLFLGGTWVTRPLVRAVRWEPYGGLRSYEFMSGEESGNPNTVEYFLGNAVESEPADESCEGLSLDEGVPDGTGRPRGVFASTGGGGTSGDILKQLYTWNAEHLVQQSTCFTGLGQAKAHVQGYSYRNTGELAAVTGVNIPTRTNGSGTSQNRSYSYDRRGNRSGATIDGCPRTYVPYASPSADLLYLNVPDGTSGCVNRFSGYTQEYSADGQLNRIGTAWWWWWTDFGYAPEATGGALSSVVKSALVQPANLSHLYYFDAFGRRRLKDIANLWQEESFHDLGLQELTSTAPDGYAMSDVLITDDYVWLDGRVIAMVRGRFIDWRRRNEDSTDCDREAEEGHCGIFHIINDQLPKPIAMLESETEGFTNAALYDEFGWMNRIPLISGFAYSPGANTAGVVSVPDTGHIHARALYNYVDLPPSSHLRMNGVASFTGSQLAHEWSDLADLGNTSSITLATTSVSGSCSTCEGVQTEAVEYFRHTPGVPPMWLPFRFPGQRYDPETDMMSNGARTYEPNTGRYLQPEPLAQDPNLFVRPARNLGMGAPVYTYALGSPILVSDRTGLAATTLEPCLLRPDCAYMMAEAGIIALGQAGLAVGVVAAAAAGTANMCAAAQSSRPVSYSRPLNPGEPIAWSPPVLWKPITSSPSKPWVAAEITEADVTDLAPGECKLIAPEPGEWFCEYHCRTPGGKPERRQRFRNLSGSGDDGCWGKLDYSDTVPYKGY